MTQPVTREEIESAAEIFREHAEEIAELVTHDFTKVGWRVMAEVRRETFGLKWVGISEATYGNCSLIAREGKGYAFYCLTGEEIILEDIEMWIDGWMRMAIAELFSYDSESPG